MVGKENANDRTKYATDIYEKGEIKNLWVKRKFHVELVECWGISEKYQSSLIWDCEFNFQKQILIQRYKTDT